jgi:hypothetical protein
MGTRPTEFELKIATIQTIGENPLEFKNEGDLIKFYKKKFGRLPVNLEEVLSLKKGTLTRKHDSVQFGLFQQELALIEILKPLLRIVDNNIEEIMLVPESEDELNKYEADDWLALKYLLMIVLESLAKIEMTRQLAEARHLSANPSLLIEAETTGSKRKVFDPTEVAKSDLKAKRLRTEAQKVQNPRPRGRGKKVWATRPQNSNPNLGPDGTPWRTKNPKRGGRGGGARGGGKTNASPRDEQA